MYFDLYTQILSSVHGMYLNWIWSGMQKPVYLLALNALLLVFEYKQRAASSEQQAASSKQQQQKPSS
jgi:hypothetical protein